MLLTPTQILQRSHSSDKGSDASTTSPPEESSKEKPKPKEKSKEEVDKEGEWKVLLHNDDVSLALARSALFPCNSANSQGLHPEPYAAAPVRRCTPSTT